MKLRKTPPTHSAVGLCNILLVGNSRLARQQRLLLVTVCIGILWEVSQLCGLSLCPEQFFICQWILNLDEICITGLWYHENNSYFVIDNSYIIICYHIKTKDLEILDFTQHNLCRVYFCLTLCKYAWTEQMS
jgi:hypothetical protein